MSERLEEIKQSVTEARKYIDENLNGGDWDYSKHDDIVLSMFDKGHVDYLIEQAKSYKDLKKAYLRLKSTYKKQAERVQELEQKVRVDSELFEKQVQQNKRYREAIERAVRHLKNLKIEDGANFAYLTLIKALESEEG